MSQQPYDVLHEHLYSLLESKLELAKSLEEILRGIALLEGDYSSDINWSYILRDLKLEVAQVDLNTVLAFIDEIEEQINDIPYKVKRATQKMRTAVNPILKNTPVFYDAANPPLQEDYLAPPPVQKDKS